MILRSKMANEDTTDRNKDCNSQPNNNRSTVGEMKLVINKLIIAVLLLSIFLPLTFSKPIHRNINWRCDNRKEDIAGFCGCRSDKYCWRYKDQERSEWCRTEFVKSKNGVAKGRRGLAICNSDADCVSNILCVGKAE